MLTKKHSLVAGALLAGLAIVGLGAEPSTRSAGSDRR